MTDALFSVVGFVDNNTVTPTFDAKTLSEAEAVFNERVSRGDVEVTIWKIGGAIPSFVKGEYND
jgi:hypothetical protein